MESEFEGNQCWETEAANPRESNCVLVHCVYNFSYGNSETTKLKSPTIESLCWAPGRESEGTKLYSGPLRMPIYKLIMGNPGQRNWNRFRSFTSRFLNDTNINLPWIPMAKKHLRGCGQESPQDKQVNNYFNFVDSSTIIIRVCLFYARTSLPRDRYTRQQIAPPAICPLSPCPRSS